MEFMKVTMELDKLPDPFTLTFSGCISTTNHPRPQPQQSNTLCKPDSVEAMREMIFRMAALQPVQQADLEYMKPPKRRNVKISKDPQSVAARHRRERISERIRILQRLVPGGTKMDTASMLEEAVRYMKFLKKQVGSLEQAAVGGNGMVPTVKRDVNVGDLLLHHQHVFVAMA